MARYLVQTSCYASVDRADPRLSTAATTRNPARRTMASEVIVVTCYTEDAVSVTVHGNGRGFDPEKARGLQQGHFELTGMQERAAIGASLTFSTLPGEGTTITVCALRKLNRTTL